MPTFRGVRLVSNQDAVLRNGLAAEWLMNESGSTLTDTSGNGNDGTINGATWYTLPSGYKVLSFDGNDYVEIGNPILPGDDELTIMAFINPSTDVIWAGPIFIETETVTGGQHTRNYLSQHRMTMTFDQFPPLGGSLNTPDFIAVGTWYHVAVVVKKPYRAIFVNGSVSVEDNSAETYLGYAPSVTRIGYRGSASPHYYKGLIGPLRVYSRKLQPWEIQALYNYDKALMGV